jgi:hypothetical protein
MQENMRAITAFSALFRARSKHYAREFVAESGHELSNANVARPNGCGQLLGLKLLIVE